VPALLLKINYKIFLTTWLMQVNLKTHPKPQSKVPYFPSDIDRVLTNDVSEPRRRWEDNIKLNLGEIGNDGANWIQLAQDKVQ